MKTIRIATLATFASLFFAAQSFGSTSQNPDWVISMNVGGSNWSYNSQNQNSDSLGTLDQSETTSAQGPSVGIVVKKTIYPDWTLDLSYSGASEFDIFASETPNQSVQRSSIELSHTKWWKYGYFGGGFGAGGALFQGPGNKLIKEADCGDQLVCFKPDEYNTVREFAPGLAVNTDFGLRYGYAGVGLRSNAMITTEGVVQMYYVHADVLF